MLRKEKGNKHLRRPKNSIMKQSCPYKGKAIHTMIKKKTITIVEMNTWR